MLEANFLCATLLTASGALQACRRSDGRSECDQILRAPRTIRYSIWCDLQTAPAGQPAATTRDSTRSDRPTVSRLMHTPADCHLFNETFMLTLSGCTKRI